MVDWIEHAVEKYVLSYNIAIAESSLTEITLIGELNLSTSEAGKDNSLSKTSVVVFVY